MIYTVRSYTADDWETVCEWWNAHQVARTLVREMLPPVGVVVECDGEPVAACWLHLSAGVGVAFLESPVSKPGCALMHTKAAFRHALGALEAIAVTHSYGVLVANTLPAIARWLERELDFRSDGDRVQLVKLIRQ